MSEDGSSIEWSQELGVALAILCGLYALVVVIAACQLVRIQIRVPELNWTTQKLFLLLTLIIAILRTVFFAVAQLLRSDFFDVELHKPAFEIFSGLPSILFFSSYTLLVLFWAEIISQASNHNLNHIRTLRSIFVTVNLVVYLIQILIWVLLATISYSNDSNQDLLNIVDNLFYSIIIGLAAISFLVFGGRLYFMLKKIPGQSSARSKKLTEVGLVTIVCTFFFTLRAVLACISAFNHTIVQDWRFIFCYYLFTELLPTWLVLFIQRELPPRSADRLAAVSLLQSQNQATRWNFRTKISPPEDDDSLDSESFTQITYQTPPTPRPKIVVANNSPISTPFQDGYGAIHDVSK